MYYLFLLLFSFYLNTDIQSILGSFNIGEWIQRFDKYLAEEDTVHSMFPLTRSVVFIIVLLFRKKIALHNQYVYIVLKICFWGLCVLPLLHGTPAIGTRLSELLGVFDIFLVSFLVYVVKPFWVTRYMVMTYCLLIFFITYNGLKL